MTSRKQRALILVLSEQLRVEKAKNAIIEKYTPSTHHSLEIRDGWVGIYRGSGSMTFQITEKDVIAWNVVSEENHLELIINNNSNDVTHDSPSHGFMLFLKRVFKLEEIPEKFSRGIITINGDHGIESISIVTTNSISLARISRQFVNGKEGWMYIPISDKQLRKIIGELEKHSSIPWEKLRSDNITYFDL